MSIFMIFYKFIQLRHAFLDRKSIHIHTRIKKPISHPQASRGRLLYVFEQKGELLHPRIRTHHFKNTRHCIKKWWTHCFSHCVSFQTFQWRLRLEICYRTALWKPKLVCFGVHQSFGKDFCPSFPHHCSCQRRSRCWRMHVRFCSRLHSRGGFCNFCMQRSRHRLAFTSRNDGSHQEKTQWLQDIEVNVLIREKVLKLRGFKVRNDWWNIILPNYFEVNRLKSLKPIELRSKQGKFQEVETVTL